MLRDAWLVAGKDLRIEARARVATNQILPFALLVLVLFAFALDPDRQTLAVVTPGLYWVTVLFTALVAVQRTFTIEAVDGGRDALRLSGLDPAGVFLGKAAGVFVQLVILDVLLLLGVVILYGAEVPLAGCAGARCHHRCRDGWHRGRRYALRRPCCRAQGPGIAAPAPAPPGCRPGPDRCYKGIRSRHGYDDGHRSW
jgi:hypothetical protein